MYLFIEFVYYSCHFLTIKCGCRSAVEYRKALKQGGTLNFDGLTLLFITCLYDMPCDHVLAIWEGVFNFI